MSSRTIRCRGSAEVSGAPGEERRVVDVDAVGSDSLAAQLEHVDERYRHGRAVLARVGHLALADRGAGAVPRAEQPMTAAGDHGEKARYRRADRLTPVH